MFLKDDYIRNTHTFDIQRDDKLFYRKSTVFMFEYCYRLKLAITAMGNRDDNLTMFCLGPLLIDTIA